MNNKPQCLIITATIVPNSNYVAQTDASARRDEYYEVLKYYLENFLGDIYFAENSGYDFSRDASFSQLITNGKVTLVPCSKSKEFEKGKGYQEFEMLDEVVSKLEGRYKEFIKVSGRYLVVNFQKLVKQINPGMLVDRHWKKRVAITSFFRCEFNFYHTHLKGCFVQVNDADGRFIEHVVYDILLDVVQSNLSIFCQTPIYKGVSGSYGASLNRHPVKIKLINIERKILRIIGGRQLVLEY